MNGPANKERQQLDVALTWLERWLIFAGCLVVGGVLLESGPDIFSALQKRELPTWVAMGGAVVALGVAAEVILGIFITKKSHRVQELADSSIAEANERAAKAHEAAAELELLAERERSARLEIEESLAPRTLVSGNEAIRRLQRTSGTTYLLEFVPDAEADRLTTQIAYVLNLSNWEQLSWIRHFDTPIRDGIAIEAKPIDGKTPVPASELAEYLRANGLLVWTASLKEPFRLDEIPDGAVRIRVGLKPNPYFEKKFADRTLETKKLLDSLSTPGLERIEFTKEEIGRLRSEWALPN